MQRSGTWSIEHGAGEIVFAYTHVCPYTGVRTQRTARWVLVAEYGTTLWRKIDA